jgi:hypothetical protein
MLAMRQSNNNVAGQPRYYAIMAGEIEVFPTPSGNYTLEMAYYSRTDALSDSNPANWLLTYHPDVYLYGALAQSAPYLKDDERIGIWKGLYDQGVAALAMEADKAKFGGSGLRMKIRSY